jgi:hypothetical protein
MIPLICVLSVGGGVAVAVMAGRYPRHQHMMETMGGFLLIGGFGLLGVFLEFMFSHF